MGRRVLTPKVLIRKGSGERSYDDDERTLMKSLSSLKEGVRGRTRCSSAIEYMEVLVAQIK